MPQFTPQFALKDKMSRAGIGIADLANHTNLSYNYISQVINGHKNSGPSIAKIRSAVRRLVKAREELVP